VKLRRNDAVSFGNLEFIYDSEHVPPGQPLPELPTQINIQACVSKGKPSTFLNALPKVKQNAGSALWTVAFIVAWLLFFGAAGYFGYVLRLPAQG
jgi:hypothetical protein